jgi:hypothetical protein
VDAYPLPDVFLGNDTLVCEGSNLILDAGAQSTYLWNDNSNQQTYSPDLSTLGIFDFSVSVTNQFGCYSIDEITIEVESCSSIKDIEGIEFVFYPNPFKDVVYSNVSLEEYEVEIYDALGRRMKILNKTNFSLEFQHTSGLYFVKIGETVKVIAAISN